jgi:multiple sugar transport system permease protein
MDSSTTGPAAVARVPATVRGKAVVPASSTGPDETGAGAAMQNIVLGLFLIYCLLPALWIFTAVTKDNDQLFSTFGFWFAYPPHFLENLIGLFTYHDGIFVRWFGNSLLYAVSISAGSTLICALGGYAFSKYEFPGKNFLFNFILGTIMVPSTALVLPLFLMLNQIGLVNSMWGVILPSLVNPFGLYLMKVFWDSSLPKELIEASRLEGAGELQIFWRIGIPLLQTGLVTVALLAFVGAWNNFFLPLIVLSREELYPLTLGLNVWNSTSAMAGSRPIYSLIALGSFISVVPLLLAFVFLGRYWRGGLTGGATKG